MTTVFHVALLGGLVLSLYMVVPIGVRKDDVTIPSLYANVMSAKIVPTDSTKRILALVRFYGIHRVLVSIFRIVGNEKVGLGLLRESG